MHWSNAPALLLPPWTPMRLHWTFQCSCIEHSNAVALNIPMQLHCFCFSNKSVFLLFVLTNSISPSLLSPPFTPTVHYNPQTSSLLQCNIQWLVYNDILCVITLLRETRTHDSGSWGSIAIHHSIFGGKWIREKPKIGFFGFKWQKQQIYQSRWML